MRCQAVRIVEPGTVYFQLSDVIRRDHQIDQVLRDTFRLCREKRTPATNRLKIRILAVSMQLIPLSRATFLFTRTALAKLVDQIKLDKKVISESVA